MLKIILFMSLILSLAGCATSKPAPKEDLRDIFILAKSKKFNEAEDKLRSMSYETALGGFLTYTGAVIPAISSTTQEDAITLLKEIKNQIETCEEKTKEVKNINQIKNTTIENKDGDEDEENKIVDSSEKFKNLQKDFTRNCTGYEKKHWSIVSKIKKYTEVDLSPLLQEYEAIFIKEVSRINEEVSAEKNKVEKEASDKLTQKNNYENSTEFYSLKLCEMRSIIKAAQSIIDRETEAAKISGFVDKKRMYDAGQAIAINNQRIVHFSSEYKNKFGKNWNSNSCN